MADKKTVEEQIADAVKGLKVKNKELLKDLKESQVINKKFEGVDIESLLKIAKDSEKAQKYSDEKKGEYKKLYEAQTEQHRVAQEKSSNALITAQKELTSERKTNALTKALAEHHVKGELIDSSAIILNDKVAINDDGVAMVGDKTVSNFVKDWTLNDIGKNFITEANSGGDADGQGGKGNVEASFYDPNSPSFNRTEQSKIANRDPVLHSSLVKSAPVKKDK